MSDDANYEVGLVIGVTGVALLLALCVYGCMKGPFKPDVYNEDDNYSDPHRRWDLSAQPANDSAVNTNALEAQVSTI